MGVSGAGKTTIGDTLSRELGWPFLDGDTLHPPENVQKMSKGIPLSDADRAPWLAAVRDKIQAFINRGQSAIVACSALKRKYRETLRADNGEVVFVYLKGSPQLLASRLRARKRHFMRPELLDSQLETLEPPHDAIIVEVDRSPREIVRQIRRAVKI
jgi:gluconokinase